ncbi:MAG: SMC-Scp complex subunit ScpB [Spirochaetales bacterium]|nr:SMC-Scp complex subunit ScpB [Spirochaetales bacterium]
MDETHDTAAALVSAILLLEHEPVDIAKLSRISALAEEDIALALQRLQAEYEQPVHGFRLMQHAGGWMLTPKLELWEKLKEHYGKKNDLRLSKAAMETLAIIAYSQPVTRAEIEAIRGVNVDGMIRLLLTRGLIAEVGKRESPGRPMQYGTTQEFLKYFRLNSLEDLPQLDEIEQARFFRLETPEG